MPVYGRSQEWYCRFSIRNVMARQFQRIKDGKTARRSDLREAGITDLRFHGLRPHFLAQAAVDGGA